MLNENEPSDPHKSDTVSANLSGGFAELLFECACDLIQSETPDDAIARILQHMAAELNTSCCGLLEWPAGSTQLNWRAHHPTTPILKEPTAESLAHISSEKTLWQVQPNDLGLRPDMRATVRQVSTGSDTSAMLVAATPSEQFETDTLAKLSLAACAIGLVYRHERNLEMAAQEEQARVATLQATDKLRQAYNSLFYGIDDPIYCVSADFKLITANRALSEVVGKSTEELEGHNCHTAMFGLKDKCPWCPVQRAVNSRRPTSARIPLSAGGNSASQIYEASVHALEDEHGQFERAVLLCKEVGETVTLQMQLVERNEKLETMAVAMEQLAAERNAANLELQKANKRLEQLATTDGMTGLPNHRAFKDRLNGAIASARENETSVGLILLDVDHFKQYNDSFGHPAGDEVLRIVGRILGAQADATAFPARYGGEEFAMVLEATDAEEAALMAEAIRAAIESEGFEHREVTVSLGVADFPRTADNAPDLIACADGALYAAKRAGRNRAVTWPMGIEKEQQSA